MFDNQDCYSSNLQLNYPETQHNSQKYYGPPPWFEGEEPQKSEIFISGLQPDVSGYDILRLTAPIGLVYQVRIPVTYTEAKGFAFVTFVNSSLATTAIEQLNRRQFMGREISVQTSFDTRVLQIMNWPKHWNEDQSLMCLQRRLKDVKIVTLYPDMDNPSNYNSGFILVEFKNHNSAAVGRRDIKNNHLYEDTRTHHNVGWTRVDFDLPEDVYRQVKDIYIGNLPPGCTIQEVNWAISRCLHETKVVKLKERYGFVYFESHEAAQEALLKLKASEVCIRGYMLTFNWVKGDYSRNKRAMNSRATAQERNPSSSGPYSNEENALIINGIPRGATVGEVQEAFRRYIDFSRVATTLGETYVLVYFGTEEEVQTAYMRIRSGPEISIRGFPVFAQRMRDVARREVPTPPARVIRRQAPLQHLSYASAAAVDSRTNGPVQTESRNSCCSASAVYTQNRSVPSARPSEVCTSNGGYPTRPITMESVRQSESATSNGWSAARASQSDSHTSNGWYPTHLINTESLRHSESAPSIVWSHPSAVQSSSQPDGHTSNGWYPTHLINTESLRHSESAPSIVWSHPSAVQSASQPDGRASNGWYPTHLINTESVRRSESATSSDWSHPNAVKSESRASYCSSDRFGSRNSVLNLSPESRCSHSSGIAPSSPQLTQPAASSYDMDVDSQLQSNQFLVPPPAIDMRTHRPESTTIVSLLAQALPMTQTTQFSGIGYQGLRPINPAPISGQQSSLLFGGQPRLPNGPGLFTPTALYENGPARANLRFPLNPARPSGPRLLQGDGDSPQSFMDSQDSGYQNQ